jgi:hypothetical protein
MTEDQFLNTTPRTFQNILNGHQKKLQREVEKADLDYKIRMELHRELAFYILAPNMEKKERNKLTLEKFYPLPWDKDYKKEAAKAKPKTKEEIQAFWEEIDRRERALKDKAEEK